MIEVEADATSAATADMVHEEAAQTLREDAATSVADAVAVDTAAGETAATLEMTTAVGEAGATIVIMIVVVEGEAAVISAVDEAVTPMQDETTTDDEIALRLATSTVEADVEVAAVVDDHAASSTRRAGAMRLTARSHTCPTTTAHVTDLVAVRQSRTTSGTMTEAGFSFHSSLCCISSC